VEEPRDEQREEPTQVDPIEKARADLERAEVADDETRLEILEELRRGLEEELDTSIENGSPRH
jgi:TPP-dependent pyruvate/acetoin dehydrogenase alpha subunit